MHVDHGHSIGQRGIPEIRSEVGSYWEPRIFFVPARSSTPQAERRKMLVSNSVTFDAKSLTTGQVFE